MRRKGAEMIDVRDMANGPYWYQVCERGWCLAVTCEAPRQAICRLTPIGELMSCRLAELSRNGTSKGLLANPNRPILSIESWIDRALSYLIRLESLLHYL